MRLYKNEKTFFKCAKYINSVTTVVHGSTRCKVGRQTAGPQLHAVAYAASVTTRRGIWDQQPLQADQTLSGSQRHMITSATFDSSPQSGGQRAISEKCETSCN